MAGSKGHEMGSLGGVSASAQQHLCLHPVSYRLEPRTISASRQGLGLPSAKCLGCYRNINRKEQIGFHHVSKTCLRFVLLWTP